MNVSAPQYPADRRQVVRSFNDDGTANFSQVGIEEISYRGRFGALAQSSTENEIAIGEKYFVIDYDAGAFRVGDDILITSLDDPDCYMWGEVIGSDTIAEPLRLTVFIDDISNVTGVFSYWELQIVARPKPGIEKDTSLSSVDPTGDGPFTFTVTAGKFFPVGGQVLIRPVANRAVALTGYIVDYTDDTLLVAKSACNLDESETFSAWSIALLDAPRRDDPLNAVSYTTLTIGSGTKTLTVQNDKFFPELGSIMLRDISRASNGYMYGVVTAYSGAKLQIDVVNSYGGGTSSYWDVILLDGPGAIYSEVAEDWGSIVGGSFTTNYGLITILYDNTEDYDLITAGVVSSDDYGAVT